MKRLLVTTLLTVALAALLLAGAAWWWLGQPLALARPVVELSIEPNTPARKVAEQWVTAGVQTNADWLAMWFRLSGQERGIRAGSYVAETGDTPRTLLARMVRGEQALLKVRLGEGWTLAQARAALAAAPGLRATTAGMSEAELAAAMGSAAPLEGSLYPDTYAYTKDVSDLAVLKRAHAVMQRELAAAWAVRTAGTPLKSAAELLTMASVVEKETGTAADRAPIAGVFTNRLRIGMPLQSDPTVIYGMGASFDGNLRRADLQADTPWNTYTRRGLPPTPIALPSRAALMAAAQPASTPALYFVAKGDGASHFSATLDEHNQAVNRYQRRGRP